MIYTGIGSRETPEDIQWVMKRIGYGMAKRGHTLRSGRAKGADRAFETGMFSFVEASKQGHDTCDALSSTLAALYLPTDRAREMNVESSPYDIPFPFGKVSSSKALNLVKDIHPNPKALKGFALRCHIRNVFQVLGTDLTTPSDFLIYWAIHDKHGIPLGGTRTAFMVAQLHNIPTINMAHPDWNTEFKKLLASKPIKDRSVFYQSNPTKNVKFREDHLDAMSYLTTWGSNPWSQGN